MHATSAADNTYEALPGPTSTTSQVLACQLSSWYPKFSNTGGKRDNVTIKSITISIDEPSSRSNEQSFRDYLLSDGVKLPLGAEKLSSTAQGTDDDWSSDDDGENDEKDDSSANSAQKFHFPQLNDQIETAIHQLGGSVLPKLNWSAPKDATWVNGGSMKCETPGDVYLLLKSSDFCLHDVLRNAWKECTDYVTENDESTTPSPPPLQLTLRKWCNLHPSMEFRCFIRQHELLAISQRNHTQHYPHLLGDMPRIRDNILLFFELIVQHQFADGTQPNYVLDVYIDQKKRIWILDFNIWAQSTDSLLFEWDELQTLDIEDDPHFRLVETSHEVRQDPLASYRAPIDTIDIATMTGGDSAKFEEFMKQCQKPSEMEQSDS